MPSVSRNETMVCAENRTASSAGYPAHQMAADDDADPVGEVLRLVHVVRGKKHRLSQVAQAVDQLPRLAASGWVEAGGRLIEDQHFRVTMPTWPEARPAV